MADVTVLGAGGATVTISLSSADNAKAAQSAVNVVNNLNNLGLLDMQEVAGAGSMPAATNFLGGLMLTGKGFSDDTGAQYIFIGQNSPGENLVLGGANFRTVVVAGDGSDLTYANLSQNAQVFYGKNNGDFVNYNGKMTINTQDGSHVLYADNGTTNVVNLGAGGNLAIADLGNGLGATSVNAAGAATINTFGTAGKSAFVELNLTSGQNDLGLIDATAIINPGAANVTLVGAGAAAATLFGGSGSVLSFGVTGLINGGAAGDNELYTDGKGATTVIGGSTKGAPADNFYAQGEGNTHIAGATDANMYGLQEFGASGGNIFNVGAGNATVFGFNVGGNTFNFQGDGGGAIVARFGAAPGSEVANRYFDFGGTGDWNVDEFKTGLDTFEVGTVFSIGYVAGDVNNQEVTILNILNGATYFFFDTNDGVQNIFDSDVTIRS